MKEVGNPGLVDPENDPLLDDPISKYAGSGKGRVDRAKLPWHSQGVWWSGVHNLECASIYPDGKWKYIAPIFDNRTNEIDYYWEISSGEDKEEPIFDHPYEPYNATHGHALGYVTSIVERELGKHSPGTLTELSFFQQREMEEANLKYQKLEQEAEYQRIKTEQEKKRRDITVEVSAGALVGLLAGIVLTPLIPLSGKVPEPSIAYFIVSTLERILNVLNLLTFGGELMVLSIIAVLAGSAIGWFIGSIPKPIMKHDGAVAGLIVGGMTGALALLIVKSANPDQSILGGLLLLAGLVIGASFGGLWGAVLLAVIGAIIGTVLEGLAGGTVGLVIDSIIGAVVGALIGGIAGIIIEKAINTFYKRLTT